MYPFVSFTVTQLLVCCEATCPSSTVAATSPPAVPSCASTAALRCSVWMTLGLPSRGTMLHELVRDGVPFEFIDRIARLLAVAARGYLQGYSHLIHFSPAGLCTVRFFLRLCIHQPTIFSSMFGCDSAVTLRDQSNYATDSPASLATAEVRIHG